MVKLSGDLDEMSANVKDELNSFKQTKSKEMRESLQGLVAANIDQQQKVFFLYLALLTCLECSFVERVIERARRLQRIRSSADLVLLCWKIKDFFCPEN